MATQNFLGKVFGRNDEVIGIVESVSEQQTGMYELIQGLQAQLEMRESRFFAKLNEIDRRFDIVLAEIKEIALNSSPAEVVKAIDNKTKEDEKLRKLGEAHAKLRDEISRHLLHTDIPLISRNSTSKNPTFTPSGQALYRAVGNFTVDMAEVFGGKRERYTNRKMYDDFFKRWNIKPYGRTTVNFRDKGVANALLASIIVNGHIRQYLEYLYGVYMNERRQFE